MGAPPSVEDLASLIKPDVSAVKNVENVISNPELNSEHLEVKKEKENNEVNMQNVAIDEKLHDDHAAESNLKLESNSENNVNERREPSEAIRDAETTEDATPSAPVLEDSSLNMKKVHMEALVKEKHPVRVVVEPCMSLKEAERLFCGNVIAEVKAISEGEAGCVENSFMVDSDHPLIDLLTTFR